MPLRIATTCYVVFQWLATTPTTTSILILAHTHVHSGISIWASSLMTFYRCLIRNFSIIISVTDCIKEEKYDCAKEVEDSFKFVKIKQCTGPVLALPNFDKVLNVMLQVKGLELFLAKKGNGCPIMAKNWIKDARDTSLMTRVLHLHSSSRELEVLLDTKSVCFDFRSWTFKAHYVHERLNFGRKSTCTYDCRTHACICWIS